MAQIPRKIQYVPVDDLLFDPENPRLPKSVDRDLESILQWMLRDATLIELMGAIGEVGFLDGEPLLAVPDTSTSKLIVIEGNRRLAAVKLLRTPILAPVRKKAVQEARDKADPQKIPEFLPVVQYDKRSEILEYLGYRHITGIKPWGALEKAIYLESLLVFVEDQQPDEQFRSLAQTIGSRADYVARLLTSLAVYNKIADSDFFDIPGLGVEDIGFTYITTALSYAGIVSWLELNSGRDPELQGLRMDRLKLLTQWMFEKNQEGQTRLGETRNLRELSKVVASEKALAAFQSGKRLADAVQLTDEPVLVFRMAIQEAMNDLQTARDSVHLVSEFLDTDSQSLKEIAQLSLAIRAVVEKNISDRLLEGIALSF